MQARWMICVEGAILKNMDAYLTSLRCNLKISGCSAANVLLLSAAMYQTPTAAAMNISLADLDTPHVQPRRRRAALGPVERRPCWPETARQSGTL